MHPPGAIGFTSNFSMSVMDLVTEVRPKGFPAIACNSLTRR
jgi:hypothetical protein